jgi:5-methyltetrahydrofolate--homocysteine methyltransferase
LTGRITHIQPQWFGNKYFNDYSLAEIAKYIDWTPFFQTWQLSGKYPKIFDDTVVGIEAQKLYDDANAMLAEIIKNKSLQANAVIGFYPLQAAPDEGAIICPDDISILSPDNEVVVLHHLRQQNQKATGLPNLCLADFVGTGHDQSLQGGIGAFAVTTGIGIEKLLEKYEADHDDYSSIMVKAIADRLAEAFTELMHERVRKEFWGYAKDEQWSNEELISEKYDGIRPAPGYPACPDHTEKATLWKLLDADKIGITLTESYAMYPASSVSGFYYAHPDSKYFTIGKIQKDQVIDYAHRKGMTLEEAEKWLSPVLAYDA